MIKILKSNKFACFILFVACFILITSPAKYSQVSLNAVQVWATKLFPTLFPFFILSRFIVNLSDNKSTAMDKVFKKLYNLPSGSFQTFVLSFISGYPMGAKLIGCSLEQNKINTSQAKSMLSICSISGPMFMFGTVGILIFNSAKIGLIIIISNLLASLVNGFVFANKDKFQQSSNMDFSNSEKPTLSDIVLDSIKSILLVCGFMVSSFLLIEMLYNFKIVDALSNAVCWVLHINDSQNVVNCIINSSLEITRGMIDLGNLDLANKAKTIISSGMIGFGGLCVIMQSYGFVCKSKISLFTIIKQKFVQGVFAAIFAFVICLFIF